MCPYKPKHIRDNTDVAEYCVRCECNKDVAKGYSICFDCLFELDLDHKNFEKYKKKPLLCRK